MPEAAPTRGLVRLAKSKELDGELASVVKDASKTKDGKCVVQLVFDANCT